MSVIAAMRAGDAVVVGADTAIYRDDALVGHVDKWLVTRTLALGSVGDYAVGQASMRPELLAHEPTPRTLAQRLRKHLRASGLQEVPPGAKGPDWGCDWLYVRRGAIWHFDGQLAYSDCGPLAAAGTGSDVAMGAMWALERVALGDIVAMAVKAAIALSAQNIGFSIPINKAKRDISQVKNTGKISYPFLGVRYVVINEKVKAEKNLTVDYGVLILRGDNGEPAITADSAADKAGLKEGDIILEFDGQKIDAENSLAKIVSNYNPGDRITLKILRDGREANIEVILGERG
jgi:hypothetical protein